MANHKMIERLYQQGILSDLDIQLGRFMAKLSGGENPELSLAAAMASHYQGEGNICLDLSSVAGKPLLEDGTEGLVFPELKKWQSILEKSPVVGRPGEFRPLILDGSRLYLYRYWDYETKLANILKARTGEDWEKVDEGALKDGLARLFPEDGQEETDWQKVAGFTSVMKKVLRYLRGAGNREDIYGSQDTGPSPGTAGSGKDPHCPRRTHGESCRAPAGSDKEFQGEVKLQGGD